jgi:hypothetical protein
MIVLIFLKTTFLTLFSRAFLIKKTFKLDFSFNYKKNCPIFDHVNFFKKQTQMINKFPRFSPLTFTLILIFTFLNLSKSYAADYFWVGGAGNWAELDHWATTSGGVVKHPQIPTANDNVFFDANSFNAASQVVTVNVATGL